MSSWPTTPPMPETPWVEYKWIVVMGGLAAFYMAWGIGANDVANSFATSVGSKTLKLWHACIIAGVMEFAGAMLLGGEVARTIAGNIADVNSFREYPELFMYGMLCALGSAGTWLLVATYWCLPVSTTHSIIGSIIGFALVWNGKDGVLWNQRIDDFPYSRGFVPVVCSWFVAPISSGIVGAVIFFINRFCILRRENSTQLSFWALPVLVFICVFVNLQFVLYKGAQRELNWSSSHAAEIAAICAAGLSVLSAVIGIPLMKRRHQRDVEREKAAQEAGADSKVEEKEQHVNDRFPDYQIPEARNPFVQGYHRIVWFIVAFKNQFLRGLFFDVHAHGTEDEATQSIHQAAEVFDPHTEQVYKYLQVFSSCCVAFAHGANDVANAIGPFSGIWYVYRNMRVVSSADAPKWIFVLGAGGIVAGLMTYGYNIIMQLGVKMLKLTPSRGFSAELSAALTVSIASRYGLPVSTTQIIVGAEIGVGLVENVRTGLDYMIIFKTFLGWVATLIIAGFTAAALFAQGVYAPSIQGLHNMRDYKLGIAQITRSMMTTMSRQNANYRNLTAYWSGPAPEYAKINGSRLNSTLASRNTALTNVLNWRSSSRMGNVLPETMLWYLNTTLMDYMTYSSLMIGQPSKAAILNNTAEFIQPPKVPTRR